MQDITTSARGRFPPDYNNNQLWKLCEDLYMPNLKMIILRYGISHGSTLLKSTGKI